jgi:hypothetical protein
MTDEQLLNRVDAIARKYTVNDWGAIGLQHDLLDLVRSVYDDARQEAQATVLRIMDANDQLCGK